MSYIEKFAKAEKSIRPLLVKLNPWFSTYIYSNGRKFFLHNLINSIKSNKRIYEPEINKFWDIGFGGALFNAAGMFKYGTGYELCVYQGAAAYLAGTTTSNKRLGNIKQGIKHPFAALPDSGAALNWMGLPNEGHVVIAEKLSKIEKLRGCPIGASIAASPDEQGIMAAKSLVVGLGLYQKAGVDFMELNESCPNVPHEHSDEFIDGIEKQFIDRLEFVSKEFLRKRTGNLPVIVKFSVDTSPNQLPQLLDLLIDLGFDGVNFGNTSTNYVEANDKISSNEQKLYSFFSTNFGGGLSGKPIKDLSLNLSSIAAKYIRSRKLGKEFHIIRTGGVDSMVDIESSKENGIYLNQWFTGYFENFARNGHKLYKSLYDN